MQAQQHQRGVGDSGRHAQETAGGGHQQPFAQQQAADVPPREPQRQQRADLRRPLLHSQPEQEPHQHHSGGDNEETERQKEDAKGGRAGCRLQSLPFDGLKNKSHRSGVELPPELLGQMLSFPRSAWERARSDAPCRGVAGKFTSGRRASRACVPTRSVGTRRFLFSHADRGGLPKAAPPEPPASGQRDKRLGRRPVAVPIRLIRWPDALGVEGEGRVPAGHRRHVGQSFHRGHQGPVAGRALDPHNGGQTERDGLLADPPFDALRLEVPQ